MAVNTTIATDLSKFDSIGIARVDCAELKLIGSYLGEIQWAVVESGDREGHAKTQCKTAT